MPASHASRCSDTSTAQPAAFSCATWEASKAAPSASRFAVGSSHTRTREPGATADATATRCFSPLDSASSGRSRTRSKSNAAMHASVRSTISRVGIP